MFKPRLNLKDKKAQSTVLLLIFEHNNKRIRYSTGISVPTKHWNKKTMFLRENREFSDAQKINTEIKRIKDTASDANEYYTKMGVEPTVFQIKEKYIEFLSNPKKQASASVFWDYFDEFVKYQESKLNKRAIIDYDKALRKHLKATEVSSEIPLSFNALKLNGGFIQKLEHYLFYVATNSKGEKGFALNSVGKQMKNLKSFLNWCFKNGYSDVFNMSHIVTYQEEVDDIYLNLKELELIENLILETEEEEKARDLFLFGCETGLRFSDLRRLKPHHISGKYLNIVQVKTEEKLTVVLSSKARKIRDKYNSSLPNYEENELTNFNTLIRGICEKAKINEMVLCKQKLKGKIVESHYKKFELVTSHTCRRTLCTNLFLKKYPIKLIMAISGHKSVKSFMIYLKLNNDEIMEMYEEELAA